MITRMNVLFFLSKKRINRKGLAPIYCRITINGCRSEFSTGISIKPNEWKNDTVINEHPQSSVYNAKLNIVKTKLISIHLQLSLSEQPINSETIKNKFFEKTIVPKSFITIMDEVVESAENNPKSANNTKNTYRIRRKNILAFLRHEKKLNILCTEITIELCQKFEAHYLKKKFTHNYINKHIFFFGQVLKSAIRQRIINYNPICNYQFTKDEVKPIVSLTSSELALMETYKFASLKLQYIADLYVFQCYTGFAFVDLMEFDVNKHIHEIDSKKYIVKNRGKTNVEALVPLFDTTKRLLLKYNNELPKISNQKYNAYIKEVAEVLGIQKHLTTHTARKTFGMIKLNEGFSIESVARMMGHNSTTITQKTYARVTHVRIDKELLKITNDLSKSTLAVQLELPL